MLSDTCCHKFLGFFRASRTMKKLSVVEKAPTFFVDGYMYAKTLNTKIKLTCRVFSTKKTVTVQPILNSGSFYQYSKAQSPKKFCGDRKNKN